MSALPAPEHWQQAALRLPAAFGDQPLAATVRSRPEDFEVWEELGFQPDGDGPHWLLWIRKRAANTDWVATALARHAQLRVSDVGYAGLKDRHAVAYQWFTVPRTQLDASAWLGLRNPEFEVLEAHPHRRKLKRGALRGNRFKLTLRDVVGAPAELDARLALIARCGVPNYFGEQRFGRDAGNLRELWRWAAGGAQPHNRSARSFTLSAGRSLIFNAVLSERVQRGDWNHLVPGEIVNLDGTGSIFSAAELTAELEERCERLDLHPTGPLWGAGELPVGTAIREMEQAVAGRFDPVPAVLAAAGLKQERRSLRLRVEGLAVEWREQTLQLQFRLPAGAFATVVLRELVKSPGGVKVER